MRHWIFQGNPDVFDINTYVENNDDLVWSVKQKHYTELIRPGDDVFLWRAAGKSKQDAGIIAQGSIISNVEEMAEDNASKGLWAEGDPEGLALRVKIHLTKKNLNSKEVVRREWILEDPVLSGMSILRVRAGTNFALNAAEAKRLSDLVNNTNRHWTRDECMAGLWAYMKTKGMSVSRGPDSIITEVALTIGRAVKGVYSKTMNFRHIDPEGGEGLSSVSKTDLKVWNEFFDKSKNQLRDLDIDQEYRQLWIHQSVPKKKKVTYADYGDAPNDDPEELSQFAAKVRRGQPAFRRNLLRAYGNRCAITGHGPEEVVEAVHIVSHARTGINELDNGLPMRADIHHLFDLHLLKINPTTLQIHLNESLRSTPYWPLNGQDLLRRIDGTILDHKYLKMRSSEAR